MSMHFTEPYGVFRYWGHVGSGREDAHLSIWKRVIFVICLTVFFLFMFVFL